MILDVIIYLLVDFFLQTKLMRKFLGKLVVMKEIKNTRREKLLTLELEFKCSGENTHVNGHETSQELNPKREVQLLLSTGK